MKKILLSASLLMVSAAAFAVTDGQTYEVKNGLKIENLWIFDRVHTNDAYLASPLAQDNYTRTAVTDGNYVYCAQSSSGSLQIYSFATGDFVKTLPLIKPNGEQISGTLCINTVGLDEYGHLYVCPYTANSDGSGYLTPYLVNTETGALTSIGGDDPTTAQIYCDGTSGRIDYIDVSGDLTGVEANASIMGAVSSDGLKVFWWYLPKGSDTWQGGWSGGAVVQEVKGTAPAETANFSTGPVVRIVRDGSATGDVSLFYIDGHSTFPALYGSDGAMIESILDADLITKDESGTVTGGTIPSPSAGTNGVAEAAVSNGETSQNLFIYSLCQYDVTPGCTAVVTTTDADMSMASLGYLWTIPADGLGTVSDVGTRVHALQAVSQADGSVNLFTFKNYNGMGVYKISMDNGGSVESTLANAATISVNGDVISVSEVAETIEVYNIAGQKVAEVRNATEVAAPATGVYIVKAVVAGTPVVKKVIL